MDNNDKQVASPVGADVASDIPTWQKRITAGALAHWERKNYATSAEDAMQEEIDELRAALAGAPAQQSQAQPEELHFNAQRLRNVAKLVGLESAVPEDDATLDGARGSVLGMIAGKLSERASTVAKDTAGEVLRWEQRVEADRNFNGVRSHEHLYPYVLAEVIDLRNAIAATGSASAGEVLVPLSQSMKLDLTDMHTKLVERMDYWMCRALNSAAPISEDTGDGCCGVPDSCAIGHGDCPHGGKPPAAPSDSIGNALPSKHYGPLAYAQASLDRQQFAARTVKASIGEDAAAVAGVEVVRPDLANAMFLIKYDEHGYPPTIIVGEESARKMWKLVSQQYNAHLFVKLESNSRDDEHYNANDLFAAPDTPNPTKEAK